MLIGLFLYGIADSFLVRGAIGLPGWDVLAQGLSFHTGIAYGWMANIIGAVVLLLWIPVRVKPGIGTVLNVLLVGTSAQLGLTVIPELESLWIRVPLFLAGLVLMGFATGLYIGPRFGPGPRDGLMTGLVARTGWKIWIIRTLIEASVLVVGWLLGGNVGIGTVVFFVGIGPVCQVFMPMLAVPAPGEPRAKEAAAGGRPAA
nr:hypothetical protein [Spelaeicoccus albus]